MSKISQLGPILADETSSNDLFVTVNLAQGEDGTKNITRSELVKSIQREVFTNIKVDGGDYINNVSMDGVTLNNFTANNGTINNASIDNSELLAPNIYNPNIIVDESFISPIEEDDYFYLKDVSLGETVAISYSQLYDEIATTAKKSNKIYIGIEGNDAYAGSYLHPVATFEKALEMAWAASEEGISTSISVLPGTYYTYGNLAMPDLCSIVSTNGQYATKIIMSNGFEIENCFLLGSGCYVQGFSFFNLKVDNFDYPSKGFAFAFRPGVRIIRSPYVRDCSQISNYFSREIPPLLKPTNSKNGIDDLGYEVQVSSVSGVFEVGDKIETGNGVTGYVSRVAELGTGTIYIRNNIGTFESNTSITSSSGGTAIISVVGEEDFPNKEVGRGGGLILADRAQVDQDSIFPYILCFGATPRTQNGIGYVAKNGAGINGISSISIFARCAFYALDGGQITLNNSASQFGDISMRAKGTTPIFNPRETAESNIVQSEAFADDLILNANTIIDDLWTYLSVDQGFNTYNSEKCMRDVGYILDGVGYDIALGTNYWSLVNGIAYRRAESTVVVGDQLVETSGAITYLKNTVANLLSNSESITRSNSSFDEIIDILENGIESADTLVFANTGNVNNNKAAKIVLANKENIQDDIIVWINGNYPDLIYDEGLCRRDTGFIVEAIAHDLNYGTNIATILNADAYFTGAISQLPLDQREPTAGAITQLGVLCSSIILGTFFGQNLADGIATQVEADRSKDLTAIISTVIERNTLQALPPKIEPNLSWTGLSFINSREVIQENKIDLQKSVIAFVNSEYDFIDEALTRRDARNLITSISNDYRFGRQTGTRIFSAGLFNYRGRHVFSVFNPATQGLNYINSISSIGELPVGSSVNINDAYIVYNSPVNLYDGTVYYWNGSSWIDDGANDISLLNAFVNSWDRMRIFIKTDLSLSISEETMLDSLIDDVLIASVINPKILRFGSLVESLSHQFNLASAGVNVNALPLNFRRLGRPISAAASVLQEEGGRVRWSGADELNNQYFARGLKINGRTGRLEGRPFTSSVRKLARRASNSRAII